MRENHIMRAVNQKDAYKITHREQYPKKTTLIYSNFTARSGKNQNIPTKGIVFIGLQSFIKDYLINEWNYTFFIRPKKEVIPNYKRRVSNILGYDVDVKHIEDLHDLGYLPIELKALPEGSFVPYGVPCLTVKNTHPDFFWVTNLIESVLSCELWQSCTSATTYTAYKKLAHKYMNITGGDENLIPYILHDFSFRGIAGRHAAASSGFAVLASGAYGTDSIPAIDLAEEYYNANSDEEIIGVSIPSTEHSCACSSIISILESDDFENIKHDFLSKSDISDYDDKLIGEYAYIKQLVTETYPSGYIGIVSDSFDFWNVITEILPRLKDEILQRDGKVVIRPDSGDPVKIICGDRIEVIPEHCIDHEDDLKDYINDAIYDIVREQVAHGICGPETYSDIFKYKNKYYKGTVNFEWNRHDKQYYFIEESNLIDLEEVQLSSEQKGLIECLWDIFEGTINEAEYKLLNSHIGAIYGDSITYKRAEEIYSRLAAKNFCVSNIVLGVGSYTYQMVSRDTHGFAFKSTYAEIDHKEVEIFKDPATDNGIKKSAKGLLMVYQKAGVYGLDQQVSTDQERHGCLETTFKNGKLMKETSLKEIREITSKHIRD